MLVKITELKNGIFEFVGSAFIIDPGYLITVAHNLLIDTAVVLDNFYVSFDDVNLAISKLPQLVMEFKDISTYKNNECIYLDLAIFDMRGNLPKIDFPKLSADALLLEEQVLVTGFSNNGNDYNEIIAKVTFPNFAWSNGPYADGKLRYQFENCFRLEELTFPGNSGSPILKDNTIIGMVCFGSAIKLDKNPTSGTAALKTSYLLEYIKNF